MLIINIWRLYYKKNILFVFDFRSFRYLYYVPFNLSTFENDMICDSLNIELIMIVFVHRTERNFNITCIKYIIKSTVKYKNNFAWRCVQMNFIRMCKSVTKVSTNSGKKQFIHKSERIQFMYVLLIWSKIRTCERGCSWCGLCKCSSSIYVFNFYFIKRFVSLDKLIIKSQKKKKKNPTKKLTTHK